MNVETLYDLFLYDLRGQYYAELTLAEQLDSLADETAVNSLDTASDESLRDALRRAFADHRDETETHVERLERVFESIDRRPDPRGLPTVDGLVEEKDRFTNVVLNDGMRLLFLLDVGVKVERFEIRVYESLVANARHLGVSDDALEALESNLRDERDALAELEDLVDGEAVESLRATLAAESPKP